MKNDDFSKQTHQQFLEFMGTGQAIVPKMLSESVLGRIQTQLNPSPFSVFVKLATIHFIVGFATLAMCPQFGISLTSSMGLMQYLMQYGESVCMLGCGTVFMGVSFLVASLVLRPEEVKVLRRNRVLQISVLASLSLGGIILAGGEVELPTGMAWALGTIIGGSSLLQIGWTMRRTVIRAVT
ncbi:MAG: hypothetical protein H7301_08410 [Cryobacterium sp.]|nr:hypothetical protein [Oligoflexia bacterium]